MLVGTRIDGSAGTIGRWYTESSSNAAIEELLKSPVLFLSVVTWLFEEESWSKERCNRLCDPTWVTLVACLAKISNFSIRCPLGSPTKLIKSLNILTGKMLSKMKVFAKTCSIF